MRSPVTELLLFPVPSHRVGVIGSVLTPVIAVARPPLPGAIAADVAVLGIGGDLLPVIVSPTLTLTTNVAADCLKRSKLRRLKGLLAIAAEPFPHYRVVALRMRSPAQARKVADLFLVEIG